MLLKHSQRNRSAAVAVRIPMYSPSPKAKRIEFRPPDPLANPYLAFSAMLMAGLDGIERELDPGEPIDRNLYELPPEQLADIPTVPDLARRGARRARGRPRLPHQGRRLHRGPHRDLRRVPPRAVRPREDPAPPVRVPALLRRLSDERAARSLDTWTRSAPPARLGWPGDPGPVPEEDPRDPCRSAHARKRPRRPVEPQRRLARPGRPDPARRQRLRRERVLDRRPAPAPAQGRLQPAPGDARGGRAARARRSPTPSPPP